MQSVSSRIWTRVAVSISYDDNHYTTGTSISIIYMRLRRAIKIENNPLCFNETLLNEWITLTEIWRVIKIKLATRRLPFRKLLYRGVREGANLFSSLLHFTLDPYLIMYQGGIKYLFLRLLYDSTWDWTLVSWATGEHSNRWTDRVKNF